MTFGKSDPMNTQVFSLPRSFGPGKENSQAILYTTAAPSVNNRVSLTQSLCCFVVSGTKKVQTATNCIEVHSGELLLIPSGNVLMTETFANDGKYEAILIFLNPEDLPAARPGTDGKGHIAKLKCDDFLKNYRVSLQLLAGCASHDMLHLKIKEITAYLFHYYPQEFSVLAAERADNYYFHKIKQIVSESVFKKTDC